MVVLQIQFRCESDIESQSIQLTSSANIFYIPKNPIDLQSSKFSNYSIQSTSTNSNSFIFNNLLLTYLSNDNLAIQSLSNSIKYIQGDNV